MPKDSDTTKKQTSSKKKKSAEFRINLDPRTIFLGILIFFIALTFYSSFNNEQSKKSPEKSLTQVIVDVKDNKVKNIKVEGNTVNVTYKNGTTAKAFKEEGESLFTTFKDANVDPKAANIAIEDATSKNIWLNILFNFLPLALGLGLLIFLWRKAQGAQDSVFSFGQSKAKRFNKDNPKVTFNDIAGINEAKKEIEEVVDFLKNPGKYKKVGARTPKGVLLVGPAGTGKTLLAKAVAGEANVPFFSIAGSEFMEMLVGIGAARVRDLFGTAKKSAPSIIFIDEVDAIGRSRSYGMMPAHDEREQTLNQILVEMDGFTPNEQVVVIAATNRGDLLDSALLRPGRFDRRIMVDYPDIEGRISIMKIHAKGKPFNPDLKWEKIAARTVGFSGADLENMLNEAAILAAREAREIISYDDLEEAATKVKLGPEKRRLQSEMDKKITAYHEAGHAIVSHFLHQTDMVQRISIVSRGMALGFTLIPPASDVLHISKTNLLERISVMMGGRAAEELMFKEVTTGASNDFSQATRIARAMVMEYGMSKLGPVNYDVLTDVTDSSRPVMEQQSVSQEMLSQIDTEIKKIIDEAYEKAVTILKAHKEELTKVADALIDKENMDQVEFEAIVGQKGKKPGTK